MTEKGRYQLAGPYDIHRDGVPEAPSPAEQTAAVAYERTHANRIIDLAEQREALVAYVLAKVRAADWHAVQDAAVDLRELEARLSMLKELRPR